MSDQHMVCEVPDCPGYGTPHPPLTFTTEQVAVVQGIPVVQLLDSSRYRPEEMDRWVVEDVPIDQLHGTYQPQPYFDDEPEYMVEMAYAIGAGDVPLPAFVFDVGLGYVHADGAHRTIIAIVRNQTTIRAYVGYPKEQ